MLGSHLTHDHRRIDSAESGSALMVAMFMTVITLGMSMATMTYLASHRQQAETTFALKGQSVQFARAGLIESVNWFRRQETQPVHTFAPQRDLMADPPIMDTDEPEVGLVREFRIQGDFWGRYEVWKEWVDDPETARTERRAFMAVSDVTEGRMGNFSGSAWRLRSTGYVFQRRDANLRFDQAPNRVRAVTVLEGEIDRLYINLPAPAALNVDDGNHATVNTGGRVIGGSKSAGIAYPAGSGTPNTGGAKTKRVSGTPALAPQPDYDASLKALTGMSFEELQTVADYVVTHRDDFPSPIPAVSLVTFEAPTVRMTDERPLTGAGLVAMRGNITMEPGSLSDFRGILHVDGNLTLRAPCLIRGAVVVSGTITIQGSKGLAVIQYDEESIDLVRRALENYRRSGPVRMVFGEL